MFLTKSLSRKSNEFYNKDPMLHATYKEKATSNFMQRYKNPVCANPNLNINMFESYRTLGKGSFGRVVLAYHVKIRKLFALKILSKEKLVQQKQVEHTINEKNILFSSTHPNILKLYFVFKDNSYLYFGIQYAVGGDLYGHLKKSHKFDESTAKFYCCQILSCFDYLHSVNVVYRDLKPENILINSRGYLVLVDFGFAKQIEKRTYTLCGTPDYLSPEILKHQPYGKSVDWWTFGIFCYELNAGEAPFKGFNFIRLYKNICTGKFFCPNHFSPQLVDLCQKLLSVDVTKRIGCLKRGTWDIIEHSWFKNCHWNSIYRQERQAPYIPIPVSQLAWALEKTKQKEEPILISEHNKFKENFLKF